ncbi:hypothetical protein JKP88DRAFT_164883 [Tribonema minus]|uniref:Uncharacterized protein n=1 Tax=Tribonema minus TaxID=303371 RepID=A0A835YV60_9STRA|nr:hypothetical protein JKP88DRAFT_164883 [Tribonema minus]
MADFMAIYKGRAALVDEARRRQQERDAAAPQERNAAVSVQRIFRGKRVRDRHKVLNEAVTKIARLFRGHRVRVRAAALMVARREAELQAVFHYHARSIQRLIRGFVSRRTRYCHAKRRAYLAELVQVGEALRATLLAHEEQMKQEQDQRALQQRQARVQQLSENLHHLVSTKAQPGVFSSPYLHPTELPTIDGVPIDEHLTRSIRDLLRKRGYQKLALEPDITGVMRMPQAAPGDRRSLQASQPYDLPSQLAAVEAVQHRLKLLGPRHFAAGERVRTPAYQRGVSEGTQFLEHWQNPYLSRGVPRSPEDLRSPPGKEGSSLGRAPARPFFTAVGGNRSAVLPNGRFDVIAEAQRSGGAAGRPFGRTRRFGVPDTCDVGGGRREALREAYARMTAPTRPKGVGGGGGLSVIESSAGEELLCTQGGGGGGAARGGKSVEPSGPEVPAYS